VRFYPEGQNVLELAEDALFTLAVISGVVALIVFFEALSAISVGAALSGMMS
jgi:hypothetical protein